MFTLSGFNASGLLVAMYIFTSNGACEQRLELCKAHSSHLNWVVAC